MESTELPKKVTAWLDDLIADDHRDTALAYIERILWNKYRSEAVERGYTHGESRTIASALLRGDDE